MDLNNLNQRESSQLDIAKVVAVARPSQEILG